MDFLENSLALELHRILHHHEAAFNEVLTTKKDKRNFQKSKPRNELIFNNVTMNNRKEFIGNGTAFKNNVVKIRKNRAASSGLKPATIYMEQNDEIRTCQNMNGVLGKI